jgi:phage-related protein
MATKNLLVRGGADFSSMKKAMDKAQQQMKSFRDNMTKSVEGLTIALAGLGVGMGIGSAVKDAMRFEASIQQLNRLMGASSAEFMNWASTSAAAFNMSKSEAVQYGATYSNIISTFADSTQQTQQYTQDLLKATSVAASMTGRTMEDALERVRSGMLGNTEAIEDLGIFVNVAMIESTKAFQQFANGKSWDQLDFRTQQQIRLFAILEQSATKYGVEVGNNAISATAQFTAQLKNLSLAIGQAFLPIWEAVLPGLTAMVSWMVKAINVVAQFMTVLFGKEPVKTAQSQADANTQVATSAGEVGDAYKKAGKEAKKAKGSLAGFDEVNTLADKSSGAEGGADSPTGAPGTGGGSAVPIEISDGVSGVAEEISAKVKKAAESLKAFAKGVKDFITEHKDIIIAALGGIAAGLLTYVVATKGASTATLIWNGIAKVSAAVMKGLRLAWVALTGPIGLIVLAVAAAVAAFIYFYRTNDKFKGFVDGVLNKIKDAAIYLWKNVLVPMGEYLAKGFKAAWEGIKVAATWLWKNVFVPFGEFLKTFYKTALVPLGNVLKEVLTSAFKALLEVGKSFWKNVMVPLGDFLKASFKPTVEALSAVLKYLWEVVIKPFGVYLGKVFIDIFKLLGITISALYNNVLKPLAPFVMNVLNGAFKIVGETIGNLKTVFTGLMKFITGVFTGDWRKAWEGVKQIFKGVFDHLYDIVKRPLNLIIDAINAVIGGFNKISVKVPDWVPDFGGKTFGINIPKIPKLARGGIVDSATNMGNYIAGEAGSEMIVPLENTSFVEKLASALGTAVMNAMSNSNASGDIILKLNEIELGRASAKSINKAQRTAGRLLLDI